MAKFRKIDLSIRNGNGYGQYVISAKYRGLDIEANTTDSMCFDYLDDDSDKRHHAEAKRTAYMMVVRAYGELLEKRAYKQWAKR